MMTEFKDENGWLRTFANNIRRQPFYPFKICVKGGWSCVIDAPEFASISRSGCIIRFHGPDNIDHIIETANVTRIVPEGMET